MQHSRLALSFCASLLAGSAALAQSQFVQAPNFIAYTNGVAPGTGGAIFNGSGAFDTGVLDDQGRMLMRLRLVGAGVVATNERALFLGTTEADLQLLIRGGDPAPGLTGLTLNTATAQGIGSGYRISPAGHVLFGSSLSGAGVTTANDSALFGGLPGSLSVYAREGDPAPGTAGATLSSAFNGPSQQSTGMNGQGRILFQSALTGGDVSGTSNNAAWYTGLPGALEIVHRKGDAAAAGTVSSSLGFISQMNKSGQVLYDLTLSTTAGATPATSGTNNIAMIYTPGAGSAVLVREGDAAPGTVGATFSNATNTWSLSIGAGSFNESGTALLVAELSNGDVVPTINDRGLFLLNAGGNQLAVRRGDAAPGVAGATLDVFSNASINLNRSNQVAFQATLLGAVTTSNDSGIWAGTPGALQLVMREGDPAPGTAGCTFGSPFSLSMLYNDRSQVLFNIPLIGGDVVAGTDQALYAWDPALGLTLMIRAGDSATLAGSPHTVGSWGGIQFNNGDGRGMSYDHDGRTSQRVNFTDGTNVNMTLQVPTSILEICEAGFYGVTPCPCGNPAAGADRGCDNSSSTGGASLVGNGVASLSADTLTFLTADEKPTATSIVLSGNTLVATGSVFGQGVRCVGGSLKRLYVKNASGGSISAPGAFDQTVSLQSALLGDVLAAGDTRYYMVYYRDPIVLGSCSSTSTFNATNGLQVRWAP
jgi:hypothetical protein